MRSRLHSLVSLVVLLGLTFSSVEAVVGELRDGQIHHETNLAALVHAGSARDDHGHEVAPSVSQPDDEEHEHGTAADHCTHQHGFPLTTTFSFNLLTTLHAERRNESFSGIDRTTAGLFRPPRA